MTFLEAAIEVLRREGKPLAVNRLAELAIAHNLLSVVGRDPEATMQARLTEVLDKGPPHAELLRVQPDLFGLRAYPERPYPPVREGEPAMVAPVEGDADTEIDEELDGPAEAEGAAGGRGRRRRRRGGGASRAEQPAASGATAAPAMTGAAAEAAAESTTRADILETHDDDAADAEAEEYEMDGSSAPLMVSTAGDEEITSTGEEREVRSEILGRRDREDRGGRGRRPERGGKPARPDRDRHHEKGPHLAPARPAGSPAPQASQSATPMMPAPAAGGARSLANDLYDILRSQDGRPQHARALAQEVEKRKILEGRPQPEVVREVRMALHGELSGRTHKGLRPRLRALGGGNYAVIDRKLDDELLHAERALEVALERAQAAAVTAVRRRLSKLSPFSFEQLGRLCAESLGVERPTLVKRGEGVSYYGGERALGAFHSRVLIGVRSGEAELQRRAVGELRAGLDARGFDEGFLFSIGRLSSDARDELRSGRAVTVYDGDSIAAFLVDKKLGVRMQFAPVPYVDVDFFAELNET
ncbi:MAG: HTH domain-containing protein [Polyangia bacterium]